jgi:hypothetical protein
MLKNPDWDDIYKKVYELVEQDVGIRKAITIVCNTKDGTAFYKNISQKQKDELKALKICTYSNSEFKHFKDILNQST